MCTQFTHVTKIIISEQVWIQHSMKWYFWDDGGIENEKSGFHELRWWLSLKVEFSLDVLGTFSRTHTCFFILDSILKQPEKARQKNTQCNNVGLFAANKS